jgi:hypothetical protein
MAMVVDRSIVNGMARAGFKLDRKLGSNRHFYEVKIGEINMYDDGKQHPVTTDTS